MLAMLVRTNFEFFSAIAAGVVYGGLYLVFGSVSGSHLNPAVTVGNWCLRKISLVEGVVFIIVQLLAGLVAWKVGQYFLGQALSKTATGGIDWRVFVSEAVGATVFGMAVAAVAYKKDLEVSRKAVILGVGLFAGILIASLASNGLLNPAVAIAARSVSWAYIAGPVLGLIVGVIVYNIVFNESFYALATTARASISKKPVTKSTAKTKKK
jgi:glycerol uptake facilitator-like aquaporin